MKRHSLLSLVGAAAFAASTSALAQGAALPELEVERLRLSPGATGGLTVEDGEVLEAGQYRVGLTGHYAFAPSVREGDSYGQPIQDQLKAHLTLAYSPLSWLQLGAEVPFTLYQTTNDVRGVQTPSSSGLGTPWVQAMAQVLHQDHSGVDLAVGAAAGLPVGRASALQRHDGVMVTPTVSLGHSFPSVRLGVEAFGVIRSEQELAMYGEDTPAAGSEAGLGFSLTGRNEGGPRGELNARGTVALDGEAAALEALVGVRVPVGAKGSGTEWFVLGGPGVGTVTGTPTVRVLAGFAFGAGGVPAALDGDEDGVPDALDRCPAAAGPVEGQGCPDTDGDGVRDDSDKCPTVRGDADGCPDRDRDGVTDDQDQCPDAAGKADAQGCPDSDGDGVVDAKDQCPTVKGTLEGCPDADGDGIADAKDACPAAKGDAALQGCPDRDGDGVADARDNCPDVAGAKDNAGCPAEQKQKVAITEGKLEILEKVYFNTGRATVQSRSLPLLDQVAQVLKAHPEIASVTVEGHTDNTGSEQTNTALSQKRADEVKRLLVKRGVEAERLTARGFGPSRPVQSNDTAEGRDANRRVEFTLGEQQQPAQQEQPQQP